jgi:8-oxo-dGTP diphosphatase
MGAFQQGADATAGHWLVIPRTLCFVVRGDYVLLMRRAPHKRVFPNQYNGLGGHIESDEDPLSSAQREIAEESGLHISDLRLVAIHHINTGQATGILLFVFVGHTDESCIAAETPEGTLEWVHIQRLAEYDLVEDLPLILPEYLYHSGATRQAFVTYDDQDRVQLRYAGEKLP